MEISAKVKYALVALLELTRHNQQGKFLQIEQIATDQQIPDRYLAQLFMSLRQCGLVRSQRGAKGGYVLARAPEQITLWEVITCLEGTPSHKQDGQLPPRSLESSLLQEIWQESQQKAIAVWQDYTLQDLCQKMDNGEGVNFTYQI